MPLLIVAGLLILLALLFGPGLWANHTLKRYAGDRPDFPGTGGELARHLLDQAGLPEVTVESVPKGDHYDPLAKAVRLAGQHFDGRSLTAVVVAAHEVGHALQDRDLYTPLRTRTELVRATALIQRTGAAIIMVSPLLALVARSPTVGLIGVGAGVLVLGLEVLVHLITLPVEFDASFKRALPLLERGGYVDAKDMPAAKRILRACALTYVAASLMSLVNLARWIRYLR